MYKSFCFLIIGLLFGLTTRAQINESDTAKVQLQTSAGGSFQTGNVELFRATPQLGFLYQFSSALVFKTQNDYLYQKIVKRKADENFNSQNYLYYHPERKVYPYALAFISTNFRRDIDLRVFNALGITYQLVRSKDHNIKLSGNLLYEKTDYARNLFNKTEFDGSNQIKDFWATIYLSGYHNFYENILNWVYEAYYQQSLAYPVNYRYQILTGLGVKMVRGLSVQSRLVYSFENVIAISNKQEDLLWIWGFSYRIKKN